MDENRLEYFKDKLLEKQLSLTDMVHRTEGYGREKDPDTQDMADMAVEYLTWLLLLKSLPVVVSGLLPVLPPVPWGHSPS